jgi:lipopolysaccharide transport system ATP-binding protein
LDAEILDVMVVGESGEAVGYFESGNPITIVVSCRANNRIGNLNVGVRIRNKEGVKLYSWGTLNQDISIWSGRRQGKIFWDQVMEQGEIFDVKISGPCVLGSNVYEVQAYISQEADRYFGGQRMLHWRDEAAFFHVQVRLREYFFGGCVDMQMAASW